MFEGIKRIGMAVILTMVAGAVLGVFVGALADNYLLWIGIMAFVGANFGLAMGYGFLPEE